MRKITICFVLTFLSVFAFSQTTNQRPKDIKDSPLIKTRIAEEQMHTKTDAKVSEYYGLENKITDVLINNTIPKNFPKSITYADKGKYIDEINLWIKQNPSFVKADKKNIIITE